MLTFDAQKIAPDAHHTKVFSAFQNIENLIKTSLIAKLGLFALNKTPYLPNRSVLNSFHHLLFLVPSPRKNVAVMKKIIVWYMECDWVTIKLELRNELKDKQIKRA